MKQFKRGSRRCNDCQTEIRLENAEAAEQDGRAEPQLVCTNCGATAPWTEIADKICSCGAASVQREFALSAPEKGVRLHVTELSSMPMFHLDGRGLEAREACTTCTDCFVCKQPLLTQECAWDEVLLEGLQKRKGLTHQYVYLHPACFPAYEVWNTEYTTRLREQDEAREQEAERRDYCLTHALCLECEGRLSLFDRFAGRLRHVGCAVKPRLGEPTSKVKPRGQNTAKRAK
jgi:hypothetical protein